MPYTSFRFLTIQSRSRHESLRRTPICDSKSGTADRGASATRAALMLFQLIERADGRAGDLAKAYDRARIAGQACENAYVVIGNARISP
jgi:hypothetical protein